MHACDAGVHAVICPGFVQSQAQSAELRSNMFGSLLGPIPHCAVSGKGVTHLFFKALLCSLLALQTGGQ